MEKGSTKILFINIIRTMAMAEEVIALRFNKSDFPVVDNYVFTVENVVGHIRTSIKQCKS